MYCSKVNLVRYADDFIVTANRKETLLEIKEMLAAFLKERGLHYPRNSTPISVTSNTGRFLKTDLTGNVTIAGSCLSNNIRG